LAVPYAKIARAVVIAVCIAVLFFAWALAEDSRSAGGIETTTESTELDDHTDLTTTTAPDCDEECQIEREFFAVWLETLSLGEKAFAIGYVAPDYLAHLDHTRPLDPFLDFLVVCEQSGNFSANGTVYSGGFGFRRETWEMMRLPWADLGAFVDAWPSMHAAPPWAQRMAAAQLWYRYGYEPWPACGQRWLSG